MPIYAMAGKDIIVRMGAVLAINSSPAGLFSWFGVSNNAAISKNLFFNRLLFFYSTNSI